MPIVGVDVRKLERLHTEAKGKLRDHVLKAIEAGEILQRVKDRLGHGSFGDWVKANLSFCHRTANRYMNAFANRAKFDPESNLTVTAVAKLFADPNRKGRKKKNNGANRPDERVPFTLTRKEEAQFNDMVGDLMAAFEMDSVKEVVLSVLSEAFQALKAREAGR